jgi:hypothetical protein
MKKKQTQCTEAEAKTLYRVSGQVAPNWSTPYISAKQPGKKEGGNKTAPKGYPANKSQYADPTNFKYPLDTEEHVRAAWSYINKAENQKGYSADELKFMMNKIKASMKKFKIQTGEQK